MRASTAKHPTSCRRRGMPSIAILTALFALAGGVQALGPAPAAAMDDSGTGPRCVSLGIPGMPQFGWNGVEVCEATNGSGGEGGQGGSGGDGSVAVDPPTVPNTEPVVEIHDPVVMPPPCPAFGCLRPRPPRGSGDRDLFGQVPPQERGGSSRGRDLTPALESREEICRGLETTLPEARKRLSALRQELRSQQDALRLMRRWAGMAPGNSLWGATDFNPRDAEPLVSADLAKTRQDEARAAEIVAGLARRAKKYACSLDVM
jgi:hypothetical protein